MKYHSPFSIIIISIVVLLLFVSVALFAVFSIGLTSPTLIIADRIMNELKSTDSSFSFSFDSLERNFRGGFTINGVKASYNGEDILSLETVRIHMGIPQLLRYFIFGDGMLDIEGSNGQLSFPAALATASSASASQNGSLPVDLNKYGISLHLHNIDLSGLGAAAENAELSAYLERDDGGVRAEASLPSVKYKDENLDITADGLLLTAVLRSDLSVSASASAIRISSASMNAEISAPIARLNSADISSLGNSDVALSFSGASGTVLDYPFSLSRSSLYGNIMDAKAVLTKPVFSINGYDVSMDEADISLTDNKVSLLLSSASVIEDGISLYSSALSEISYDINTGAAGLRIGEFSSDILKHFGQPFALNGTDFNISGNLESKYVRASGSIYARSEGSALDGTGGRFSFSLGNGNDGSPSGYLSVSEFNLPGMESKGNLFVSLLDGKMNMQGSFGDYLEITGEVNDGIKLSAFYTDLPLYPFIPLVRQYVPVLYNYVGNDTAATGNISIDFDSEMTGPMDFALAISDIAFNDFFFSLAASGSGELRKDGININQISLTSDFVRLSFSGDMNFRTNLPEGRLVLSMTDSGYELFVADLTLESDEEYYFSAEIPYFSSSWLRGNVNWSDENVIESSATLKSGEYYYPFDIRIDFLTNLISLDNDNAHAEITLGEILLGTLSFENFELPEFRDDVAEHTYFNGLLTVSFNFAEQQLMIASDDFVIGSISVLPDSPDLSFSVHGDNTSLLFDDIALTSDSLPPLNGAFRIDYQLPSIALSLSSPENERLLLSIVHSDDGMYSGLLRADSFDLDRFGIAGMVGNVNLTARAGTWDSLSFSGTLRAYSSDMINNPATAEADIYLDRDEIEFSSISYTAGNLSIGADEIRFSSDTGLLHADAFLRTAIENANRLLPVSTEIEISAVLTPGMNLADSIFSIFQNRLGGTTADISLGNTNLGDFFSIEKRNIQLSLNDGTLDFKGDLLNGYYDIENRLVAVDVDLMPVADFRMEGSFGTEENDAELRFIIDGFEISVADLFLKPSIYFYGPAPAKGEIIAVKSNATWNLSGWLSAEEVAFDVFWMPGERVILHNPYFSVWNNSFASLLDDCTVLDTETYERTPGRVSLTIDLGPSLSMDGWYVDVYADEEDWIGIRLPMPSSNVDIWGDINGYLRVGEGSDGIIYLDGDLNASNLTMSLGMRPMPEWMLNSDSRTKADLSLRLTENVKFVFPLTGDPILRADLAEYQNLRVVADDMGNLDVSGSLDIRSGEIFYFQKNFYITEGNISFRQSLTDNSGFNPIINLRARLRDFDSDGNQVDIYLILRDATMDNLSPSFESSPSKPLSEIMQILGQSILPNSVYGDISVSSMVSLVSASVDILSRFGIISSQNDNTLEQSIRSSLSLDTFSLHTNIIENLIFDTVSYASSNLDDDALSPMARYLDGTTLYLGKYISPELYLEGMIHLDAESNQIDRSHTFLADDLNLDIEISLEWNNPLALFTIFTRPENVTFYDIIDSFGFGVSKRIVW